MAYTPELSKKHSGALRRIAWALDLTMTKTMERVFYQISQMLDNDKICLACRDKDFCTDCPFQSTMRNLL